jgi:hypothetical protein
MRQVWYHTATRSSIIPQKCGVAMMPLYWSRQWWRRKSSYKTTIAVGNDAAPETSLVSYCFLSSIISQECRSGIWCHYKDQVGSDAASCPTRRRFKTAMMTQVVLPDDESSRQWCHNQSRQWCRKKDLVWYHTAFIAAKFHRSVEVASMPL